MVKAVAWKLKIEPKAILFRTEIANYKIRHKVYMSTIHRTEFMSFMHTAIGFILDRK